MSYRKVLLIPPAEPGAVHEQNRSGERKDQGGWQLPALPQESNRQDGKDGNHPAGSKEVEALWSGPQAEP